MRDYLYPAPLLIATTLGWWSPCLLAQDGQAGASSENVDAERRERREILQSERWRKAYNEFEDWLAVQQIYRPEEIATIRQQMRERVANMSAPELERFLAQMEERLRVLNSPEAADARQWLKQFMAVARNPEQQLGRQRPDVLNMTAAQIRQEINWLEQHRAGRQQAQTAFNRSRAAQSQIARDVHVARQNARPPADRSAWPANTPRTFSPYAPRQDAVPTTPNPVLMIGPWGAPYIVF